MALMQSPGRVPNQQYSTAWPPSQVNRSPPIGSRYPPSPPHGLPAPRPAPLSLPFHALRLRGVNSSPRILPAIQKRVHSCPLYLYHIKLRKLVSRKELVRRITAHVEYQIRRSVDPGDNRSLEELAQEHPSRLDTYIQGASAYAILSHRWEEGELSFGEIRFRDNGSLDGKQGFVKFDSFCQEAGKPEYRCVYAWADTVCIDQKSSTELDESIRSMYNWYRNSQVCIVYLSAGGQLGDDPWFKRGWTLQELLAPRKLKFFLKDWSKFRPRTRYDIVRQDAAPVEDGGTDTQEWRAGYFDGGTNSDDEDTGQWGTRPEVDNDGSNYEYLQDDTPVPPPPQPLSEKRTPEFLKMINEITHIDLCFLENYEPHPINARDVFQWLSERTTSRAEDKSYCLLGLLDIQIPIAYGEGEERAFYRVQTECALRADNRSLFLWSGCRSRWNSMFASDPSAFSDKVQYPGNPWTLTSKCLFDRHCDRLPNLDPSFTLTNCGLRIMLTLHPVKLCEVSTEDGLHKYVFTIFNTADTAVSLRWWGALPAADKVEARWQLGVVANFDNGAAFAILLCKDMNQSPPRYTRLTSAVFETLPDLESLTRKPPRTVWIQ
ncbi:hypothetical protein EYR40_003238 [Pleurotus pulmonarius]|nr:hypothetical protein EYR40_003238 [Pleurotus pulmonarius]